MWIIDRFEGDFAVIECDDITFSVPKSVLPVGIAEGDCLRVQPDSEATAAQAAKAQQLMKKLFDK